MADITITCQTCGNVITVSEYVDAEFLTCMKCKTQVPVPVRVTEVPVTQKLKIAVEKKPEPPPPSPVPVKGRGKGKKGATPVQSESEAVRKFMPKAKRKLRQRQVSNFEAKILPWILFVVLSIGLGVVRYIPGVVSDDTLKVFISGGVVVLAFMYVTVICYAFTDDSFFGILSLIIPGYPLYYLFIQSDQMIFRGVMAALMVTFGWDFSVAVVELWNNVYITVSQWIATTDSVKK